MARVITYSTKFPYDHPRASEPTYFVEKVIKGFEQLNIPINEIDELAISGKIDEEIYSSLDPKWHTVREGFRFNVGDWFSPHVWSVKPYRSKQIILAPDVQIKKIWNVEIDEADIWAIGLPGTQIKYLDEDQDELIAINDGLTQQDMYWWFKPSKKPFNGQIICWNENINY